VNIDNKYLQILVDELLKILSMYGNKLEKSV